MEEQKMINQIECKRCGYKWFPTYGHLPVQCAHCRSPYWNRERVNKSKK